MCNINNLSITSAKLQSSLSTVSRLTALSSHLFEYQQIVFKISLKSLISKNSYSWRNHSKNQRSVITSSKNHKSTVPSYLKPQNLTEGCIFWCRHRRMSPHCRPCDPLLPFVMNGSLRYDPTLLFLTKSRGKTDKVVKKALKYCFIVLEGKNELGSWWCEWSLKYFVLFFCLLIVVFSIFMVN